MKRTARFVSLLLIAVLALGGMFSARGEAICLSVTLSGQTTDGEGNPAVIRLEGSFRVWQNGREVGVIRAWDGVLNLASSERVRLEPLPESIVPGWDLREAWADIQPENGVARIEVTLLPATGDEVAVIPSKAEATDGTEQIPAPATETAGTETTGDDGGATPVLTAIIPEGMELPTAPPLPETTPEPALPGAGNGTGMIRVKAFSDTNGNGERGPYEKDAPVSVTVYLLTADGEAIARNDTGAGGETAFTGLKADDYRIRVFLPEGWCFTKKGKTTLGSSNCMNWTQEGDCLSDVISLAEDQAAERGVGIMKSVRVSGYCWLETDADGIRKGGESVLPGVRITLDGQNNADLHYETWSDGEGNWVLERVSPANYTLTAYAPEGMMFTRYSATGGNSRSILTREGVTKATKNLDLSDGGDEPQQNIGFMWAARISGQCFQDANYNGIYDEGELPMAGVKVSATRQGAEDPVATAISGEDGTYTLNGLRGNTYRIRALLPDDGSDFTRTVSDPEGNHFKARPDRRENFINDLKIPDASRVTVNVGAIYPGSVTGTVYLDDDFSGEQSGKEKIVSGFLVKLLDEEGNLAGQDRTSVKGVYEITGLAPGTYRMELTAIEGYAFTRPGEGNVALNRTGGEGYSDPFRVELGEDRKGMDIGMIRPATVRGTVFADRNDNGLRDEGENGLEGVTVRLMSEEGEAFRATIGAEGGFLFDAVMPGAYWLEYVLPEHATFAVIPNAISGGNTITGVDGTGRGDGFTIASGEEIEAPLCGALTLGRIAGTAFADHNGDGQRNEGEEWIAGAELILTPGRSDLDEIRVSVDQDGTFDLTELRPDQYTLRVVAPDGYVISRTDALALHLKAGLKEQKISVEIPMGQTWMDQGLGFVMPAGLAGHLWLDENDNGLFDEGEATPAGYRITVTDERTGAVFDHLTTDGEGRFATAGMIPGLFSVSLKTDERTMGAKDGDSTFREEEGRLVMDHIALRENDTRGDLKMGVVRLTAIGGEIWMDRGGEFAPVEGALVTLIHEGDGEGMTQITATDETGLYRFDGLMPGTYRLEADMPEGCVVVEPADLRLRQGAVSVMVETDGRHGISGPIEVKMGQDRLKENIGGVLPGTLGDLCWLDENGDGLQGAGEGGIPGVKIELERDGKVIAETVSDQYGFYRFSDLYPAAYTLRVTAPAEVKPTRRRTDLKLIASILIETDEETAESVEARVESGRANYNADLGFVCRKDGVLPPGYGKGKTQNWKQQ